MKTRKSKDWATQILRDLAEFEIDLTMEEIGQIPQQTWKTLIKKENS